MRENVDHLLLVLWGIIAVVCFVGVGSIQAKNSSRDEVDSELEPDVRGQVDVPAGMDSISLYFEGVRSQQQEKLWLHLNQPYYAAGDTIWFKGYLVDAMNHRRDTLSNFIYVDLVDQRGRFILSKKIKRDSLGFANGVPSPIPCLRETTPCGLIPAGCSTSTPRSTTSTTSRSAAYASRRCTPKSPILPAGPSSASWMTAVIRFRA